MSRQRLAELMSRKTPNGIASSSLSKLCDSFVNLPAPEHHYNPDVQFLPPDSAHHAIQAVGSAPHSFSRVRRCGWRVALDYQKARPEIGCGIGPTENGPIAHKLTLEGLGKVSTALPRPDLHGLEKISMKVVVEVARQKDGAHWLLIYYQKPEPRPARWSMPLAYRKRRYMVAADFSLSYPKCIAKRSHMLGRVRPFPRQLGCNIYLVPMPLD